MSYLRLGSLKFLICFGITFNSFIFFECIHTNCASVNVLSNNNYLFVLCSKTKLF
jgi:hypothetical protein